jgi:hypothetical protein
LELELPELTRGVPSNSPATTSSLATTSHRHAATRQAKGLLLHPRCAMSAKTFDASKLQSFGNAAAGQYVFVHPY